MPTENKFFAAGVTLQAARANRVYVVGPMTGIADFNYPAFNAVADQLRTLGYEVENPADHGIVDGAQWANYMAYDLTRLGLCGVIALLPDWEKSQGAKLEVLIAERLGMTVVNAHDLVAKEAVTPFRGKRDGELHSTSWKVCLQPDLEHWKACCRLIRS